MNNLKKQVELLAPVGSFESLRAAIQAGADAVYFGVEQLNMRAKSVSPITLDDLPEISAICRQAGIKACLTLNTILYDHDIQLARRIIQSAKQNGIHAVIASDFAAIELCRKEQVPVHISTQANVSNYESVAFFAPFADVVVLARELTLKQVAAIAREIERNDLKGISGRRLKIEAFIHGALCMAVSGKCYLSLHNQNSSANRGACIQNCRHPYKVTDLETGTELVVDNEYIMSPKDLCTIDFLDEIVMAGVDVLKIEGRGKSADYVYTVTKCYRAALDALEQGTFTKEKAADWKKEMETVFNRGFWEGYYLGKTEGEWSENPGSVATEKKIYLGKGVKYYPGIQVAEFAIETGTLKQGDSIMIISPVSGVTRMELNEMKINGNEGTEACKGDALTFPLTVKTGRQDKLYKIVKERNA